MMSCGYQSRKEKHTRLYFEEHAEAVLTAPLVGNFAISAAAAFHVGALKFPPSPASAFLQTRNSIKRLSSSTDHWLLSEGSLLAFERPRSAGMRCGTMGVWDGPLI